MVRTAMPIPQLALDGASRQAGDEILDKKRVEHRHRHRAEQRAGHQAAPEEDVAANQLAGHPERDRFELNIG